MDKACSNLGRDMLAAHTMFTYRWFIIGIISFTAKVQICVQIALYPS